MNFPGGGTLQGCDCRGEGAINLGAGFLPGGDLARCTLHCGCPEEDLERDPGQRMGVGP